jgi:hypothetical protein
MVHSTQWIRIHYHLRLAAKSAFREAAPKANPLLLGANHEIRGR